MLSVTGWLVSFAMFSIIAKEVADMQSNNERSELDPDSSPDHCNSDRLKTVSCNP